MRKPALPGNLQNDFLLLNEAQNYLFLPGIAEMAGASLCMPAQVLLHVLLVGNALPAYLADQGLLSLVPNLNVIPQGFFHLEDLAAKVTSKICLLASTREMLVEDAGGGAVGAASGAFKFASNI